MSLGLVVSRRRGGVVRVKSRYPLDKEALYCGGRGGGGGHPEV